MRLSALAICAAVLAVLPLSAQNFSTHPCGSDEDHGAPSPAGSTASRPAKSAPPPSPSSTGTSTSTA